MGLTAGRSGGQGGRAESNGGERVRKSLQNEFARPGGTIVRRRSSQRRNLQARPVR